MNDFTTELLQTLATKGDLNELFRSHLELAVNTLLRTEDKGVRGMLSYLIARETQHQLQFLKACEELEEKYGPV
uniref:manganese catalase family protein n=1 Tax=Aerococcus urinaeequi TaxID=51665 RepID=UPI00352A8139